MTHSREDTLRNDTVQLHRPKLETDSERGQSSARGGRLMLVVKLPKPAQKSLQSPRPGPRLSLHVPTGCPALNGCVSPETVSVCKCTAILRRRETNI